MRRSKYLFALLLLLLFAVAWCLIGFLQFKHIEKKRELRLQEKHAAIDNNILKLMNKRHDNLCEYSLTKANSGGAIHDIDDVLRVMQLDINSNNIINELMPIEINNKIKCEDVKILYEKGLDLSNAIVSLSTDSFIIEFNTFNKRIERFSRRIKRGETTTTELQTNIIKSKILRIMDALDISRCADISSLDEQLREEAGRYRIILSHSGMRTHILLRLTIRAHDGIVEEIESRAPCPDKELNMHFSSDYAKTLAINYLRSRQYNCPEATSCVLAFDTMQLLAGNVIGFPCTYIGEDSRYVWSVALSTKSPNFWYLPWEFIKARSIGVRFEPQILDVVIAIDVESGEILAVRYP